MIKWKFLSSQENFPRGDNCQSWLWNNEWTLTNGRKAWGGIDGEEEKKTMNVISFKTGKKGLEHVIALHGNVLMGRWAIGDYLGYDPVKLNQ